MYKSRLRTKFLLSFALVSISLTAATLFIVQYRMRIRVREGIVQDLQSSVTTFESLQQQREITLERSAALLADLPPLKAVMTSQDELTIQDASAEFWHLVGSELFAMADPTGKLMALHTDAAGFGRADAQELLRRSLRNGESRDWWYGSGHLFQIFIKPIYFGSSAEDRLLGVLALGYEMNGRVAQDISRVAASHVAFRYGPALVVSTLSPIQQTAFVRQPGCTSAGSAVPQEVVLGEERFLCSSVALSLNSSPAVTLTVIKSFDRATAFLKSLNRWIVLGGTAAVVLGWGLIFVISTTFTRPLANLLTGVHALEQGDFSYPLHPHGSDEISELTSAFDRMRRSLRETQGELLASERLATIGRMASTISHDLRHPLTAILAYAEFLSEGSLTPFQRKDFYGEIRLAVNRMTEQLGSLLGFSGQRDGLRCVQGRVDDVIERAIQTVQARPEFAQIDISLNSDGNSNGWFDPSKLERVLQNLLINACEAVRPDSGKIEVTSRSTASGLEIRVADNGTGIPEPIRKNLFEPFASYGKENGIGLGLTVVQKIIQDHGGGVTVERSGPDGSTFRIVLPSNVPTAKMA
jgi:signal transduction histidine kinase